MTIQTELDTLRNGAISVFILTAIISTSDVYFLWILPPPGNALPQGCLFHCRSALDFSKTSSQHAKVYFLTMSLRWTLFLLERDGHRAGAWLFRRMLPFKHVKRDSTSWVLSIEENISLL